jgi:phage terminase small subunit
VARKPESDRIRRLRNESDKLSGFDKALLDDLLVEYDALAAMVEKLRSDVDRNGVMVVVERGGANNRHEVMAENPAFTAYQKAIGRLGDLAKKISDFAKRSDEVASEDTDDLVSWNRVR